MAGKIIRNITGQLKNQILVDDTYFDELSDYSLTLKPSFIASLFSIDGWLLMSEVLTYVSTDAPSYVVTCPGDVTTKYSLGMKIKLTDGGVQYFFITKISFGAGVTTFTLYGGTNYSLSGDAIILPYFSTQKAPYGFPLNPAKWSIILIDTITRTQLTPTGGTFYNLGALSIELPIGSWQFSFDCNGQFLLGTGVNNDIFYLGFSSNNAAWVEANLYGSSHFITDVAISGLALGVSFHKTETLDITAKTLFYFLGKCSNGGAGSSIASRNGLSSLVVRAVCSYI